MSSIMSTHRLNHQRGRVHDQQSLFHRGARLAAGVLLAGSVACGGDSNAPETIEGTYTLQTIDGRPLPVVLGQDANEISEITAGEVPDARRAVLACPALALRLNGPVKRP